MQQFEVETILLQIHRDLEKLRMEVANLHSFIEGAYLRPRDEPLWIIQTKKPPGETL
jgi:predicted transposase YdaD